MVGAYPSRTTVRHEIFEGCWIIDISTVDVKPVFTDRGIVKSCTRGWRDRVIIGFVNRIIRIYPSALRATWSMVQAQSVAYLMRHGPLITIYSSTQSRSAASTISSYNSSYRSAGWQKTIVDEIRPIFISGTGLY